MTDLDKTEANRDLARQYTEQVLIGGQTDQLERYVDVNLIQHSPAIADGLASLRATLEARTSGARRLLYYRLHRVLAEGNFVLCVSEGFRDNIHSSFYDLYRIEDDKIAEHWETIEAIAPRSEWKNDNGKF